MILKTFIRLFNKIIEQNWQLKLIINKEKVIKISLIYLKIV